MNDIGHTILNSAAYAFTGKFLRKSAANTFDKYNTEKSGLAAGLVKGHVVVKYSAKSKTTSSGF